MAADAVLNLIIRLKDEASAGLGNIGGALAGVGGAAAAAGLAAVGAAAVGVAAGLLDVSDRAAKARNTLQEFEDVDYDDLLADASLLETRYGADLQGVLGATRTLMDEFGLTSKEATDFLISGYERGLDASGDLLDSVSEYGNLFAENGADADQFFSTLETGMAGGVNGTDKAADAFKEFGIRIRDGSDATAEALEALGLEDVTRQLADGTLDVTDAWSLVQDALRGVEDPLLQTQLGVALIGTQFEDLGNSAVLGIDMAATSMEDLNATAEAGRERFGSLGEILPKLWGEFTAALLPASDAMLAVANDVAPLLSAGVETLGGWVSDAANGFALLTSGLGGAGEAGTLFGDVWAVAQPFLDRVGEWAQNAATWFRDELMPAVSETGAGFAEMLQPHLEWLAEFAEETLIPAIEKFAGFLADNLPGAIEVLGPIVTGLVDTGLSVLELALAAIAETWTNYLEPAFSAMAGWLEDLTGGWDNLARGARVLKQNLSEVAESIRNLASGEGVEMPDFLKNIKIPGFADGVENFSGGLAIVGERGPELVRLPGGSDVLPAGPTAAMLGRGGGGGRSATINFNGITVDSEARLQALIAALRQEFAEAVDELYTGGI